MEESDDKLEFGRITEIQKDELEPVCLFLTSCKLDDMGDVQSMLLSFINRGVHVSDPRLLEGREEKRKRKCSRS